MAKSNTRKIQPPSPNASQLTAVRRLAESGDEQQARQRLAALRASFPDFKPLLGLAWEVEDSCGSPMLATARALEWQQAAPNSRAAIAALAESASDAGLMALYGRALQRLSVMDGQSHFALPERFDSALGALNFEQAEAIDLSRMHLADANPMAAIAVLQDVDHPSARNNIALAWFVAGDMVQASAVIEANWQTEPNNLYALYSLIRWRCWAQGVDRCMGFAAPLRTAQPLRAEDAIAQVAALRFLGDEKAALLAWQACDGAPYWSDTNDDLRADFDDLQDPALELPGGAGMWFPSPWINALMALAGHRNREQREQQWDVLLEQCGAHADYLTRAVDHGGARTRLLAMSVLKLRAKRADTAALSSLNALLTHPNGPDSARMDLLDWLAEQGLRNRADPVEVWVSGSLRTLRSHSLSITNEPRPSPFPKAGTALNQRMHQAMGRNDWHEALGLAQQLCAMYPREPSALTNLASIKQALGHPQTEVVDLYQRAHTLDPDYLFARCALARYLADERRTEEARKLLDGILEREEFHRSEYRSYLVAQLAIASALGEQGAMQTLRDSLAELDTEK